MDKISLAKIIWEYHHMNHIVEKAECIIVLGSHDLRVADRGTDLYLDGYAPVLVFSGGLGRLTKGMWDKPEARIFAEKAIKAGVPENKILIEENSANTGENILFTRELLCNKGYIPSKAIAVQKPYMERRTFATFGKLWPELDLTVTSPQMSFEEYCSDSTVSIGMNEVINIMVGDLQRIAVYPQKGFQIRQEIPGRVWDAFEQLVGLGYNKHLI